MNKPNISCVMIDSFSYDSVSDMVSRSVINYKNITKIIHKSRTFQSIASCRLSLEPWSRANLFEAGLGDSI
ncbi:hypothetical protein ACFQJ7_09645 [Halovenus rubra]|uniref:Uncharacterized protein n=2 Tax=Halovenus rubra TaxID=869890 RepID=A0ACC7DVZ9_9EURY